MLVQGAEGVERDHGVPMSASSVAPRFTVAPPGEMGVYGRKEAPTVSGRELKFRSREGSMNTYAIRSTLIGSLGVALALASGSALAISFRLTDLGTLGGV